METEYILDSSHVGFTFPEVDGYILSLVRSRGPLPELPRDELGGATFRSARQDAARPCSASTPSTMAGCR